MAIPESVRIEQFPGSDPPQGLAVINASIVPVSHGSNDQGPTGLPWRAECV